MTWAALHQFLLHCGVGVVATGVTACLISWAVTAAHLRGHHPQARAGLRGFLFAPHAFVWYLRAHYHALDDVELSVLGLLATLGTWAVVIGVVTCAISQIISWLASIP